MCLIMGCCLRPHQRCYVIFGICTGLLLKNPKDSEFLNSAGPKSSQQGITAYKNKMQNTVCEMIQPARFKKIHALLSA